MEGHGKHGQSKFGWKSELLRTRGSVSVGNGSLYLKTSTSKVQPDGPLGDPYSFAS